MATLQIGNRKEFDQQVWQLDSQFDTEKYNVWLHETATKALQRIYDILEEQDDLVPADEFYMLGDVINLLNAITVDADHRAESWTCTAGDFDGYDTSNIDEDEMEQMIDEVAKGMQNNDSVSECYWMHVEMVAEQHGCPETPCPWGPDGNDDDNEEDNDEYTDEDFED